MMKYHEWLRRPGPKDFPDGSEFILISEFVIAVPADCDDWAFFDGTVFQEWSPENHALYRGRGPLWDFLVATPDIKVISGRLKDFLEKEIPGEIQCLPIRLVGEEDGEEIRDYFVMIVKNLVDCIDLDKTPHEVDEDDPELITRTDWQKNLVLRRDGIGDRKLFRPKRHPMTLVIREDLKAAIEAQFTQLRTFELEIC